MKQYAINSNTREKVYSTLYIISLAIVIAISAVFNILTCNVNDNLQWLIILINVILFPTSAGIYAGLKALFNKHIWKTKFFQKFLSVKNISGEWTVRGKNNKGFEYTGGLTIVQTFEKIAVVGKFDTSDSINEETYYSNDGVKITLSYYYNNTPNSNRAETMSIHHGFSILEFEINSNMVSGKYFSDDFRETNGTWQLTEKNKAVK